MAAIRHTFATRLIQKGVDLYKLSKLLGHSSVTITERYANHCPESLRSGVQVLEERGTAILEESVPPKKQEGTAPAYHTFITPAVISLERGYITPLTSWFKRERMVPPARIELATPGLGNLCSILLS